ncbi:hypothetical protein JW899_02490, partial [Candidatus Uhrbacteria bacterium]|nr:hypothetical protein [Candidatus Uhrbacteria bacterium]
MKTAALTVTFLFGLGLIACEETGCPDCDAIYDGGASEEQPVEEQPEADTGANETDTGEPGAEEAP